MMQNPRLRISSAVALTCAAVCAAGCGGRSSSGFQSSAAQVGSSSARTPASSGGTATASAAATSPTTPTSTGGASASTSAQTATNTSPALPSLSGGTPGAVATANTICARRNHELGRTRIVGIDSLPALMVAARRRVAIERHALSELTKLTPPPAIAPVYRKLIAADRAALLRTVKLGEQARAGDSVGVRTTREKVENGDLRSLVTATKTQLYECAAVG